MIIKNKNILAHLHRYFESSIKKSKQLRTLIEDTFRKGEGTLEHLKVTQSYKIKDEYLQILLQLSPSLQKKVQISMCPRQNPFVPPFQEGIFICDLLPKHRLLFNKYYIYKNQLLIVTADHEKQGQRINVSDFQQIFTLLDVMQGSFYYNCGPNSGFSQTHKHVHVLPKQTLELPIMLKLRLEKNTNRKIITKQQSFPFLHAIVKLEGTENASEIKQQEELLYNHMSTKIGHNNFGYNIVGCRHFMMMIPRAKQFLDNVIGVNGIGFMGVIHFTSDQLLKTIMKKYRPSQIYKELTYPFL